MAQTVPQAVVVEVVDTPNLQIKHYQVQLLTLLALRVLAVQQLMVLQVEQHLGTLAHLQQQVAVAVFLGLMDKQVAQPVAELHLMAVLVVQVLWVHLSFVLAGAGVGVVLALMVLEALAVVEILLAQLLMAVEVEVMVVVLLVVMRQPVLGVLAVITLAAQAVALLVCQAH